MLCCVLFVINLCFCSMWSSFNAWRQAAATTHQGDGRDRPKTCHSASAQRRRCGDFGTHTRALCSAIVNCRPGRLCVGGTLHRMFSLQQIAVRAARRRATSNQAPLADHTMTPPSVKLFPPPAPQLLPCQRRFEWAAGRGTWTTVRRHRSG